MKFPKDLYRLYAARSRQRREKIVTIGFPVSKLGASAVSDQDEFYMYLWLVLSQNSGKRYYLQPKSCSIVSY